MTNTTPIARLRALHEPILCPDCGSDEHCGYCGNEDWPCDTIAALDALQARIDAATMLIREVDTLLRVLDTRMCGTGLSHFCDFSEPRMHVRAWLAGDKEAHGDL